MNYLFFDTECARGFGGICEFGYVITDEAFNILKTENLLINPKMSFDDYGHKKAGIEFAHTKEEYRSAPDFKQRYAEIAGLLGDKNNVVMGYSTDSDAKFILNDIAKENLPEIDYGFWDVMKMYQQIAERTTNLKLHVIYSEVSPESELVHHEALNDALMTLEVFKSLLKEYDLTASELFERYPATGGEVFCKRIVFHDGSVFNYTKGNHTTPANKRIIDKFINCEAITRLNDDFDGKIFSIAPDIVKENFAVTLAVCVYCKERGAEFTLSICSANYLLAKPGYRAPQGRLRRGVRFLGFSQLENLLSLPEDSLDEKNIDVDSLIARLPENVSWYEKYLEAHTAKI